MRLVSGIWLLRHGNERSDPPQKPTTNPMVWMMGHPRGAGIGLIVLALFLLLMLAGQIWQEVSANS